MCCVVGRSTRGELAELDLSSYVWEYVCVCVCVCVCGIRRCGMMKATVLSTGIFGVGFGLAAVNDDGIAWILGD